MRTEPQKRSVVIEKNQSWLFVISVMLLIIGCHDEKKSSPSCQTQVWPIEFSNSECWISRTSVGKQKDIIVVEYYDQKTNEKKFVRVGNADAKTEYESIQVKYFKIPYPQGIYLIRNKEITYYDTEIPHPALSASLQSLRDYASSGKTLSVEELCRILSLKEGRLLKGETGAIQWN